MRDMQLAEYPAMPLGHWVCDKEQCNTPHTVQTGRLDSLGA